MYDKEFQLVFDYANEKVDDIELLFIGSDSFSSRVHQQQVEAFDYAEARGISIRVLLNGKSGYSYSEKIDGESLTKAVDIAVKNAKAIESEEEESVNNYEDVKDKPHVYNPTLEQVPVEDKITLLKNMEKLAFEYDKRVINVPYVMYGDSTHSSKIANSKGLNKEDKQNFAYCYLGVLSEENNEKRMGMHYHITRDFSSFQVEELVKTAVEKSISLLNSKPISSGAYPVVFNNDMTAALLDTFSAIFSGKMVMEGKTLLMDKIGKVIANENVSLIDDGLHPEGYNTSAFDSEGYPSEKTVLIDKGKLKSFLHNTHTARYCKAKSTGNGSRSLKSSLNVSPSNFYMEPGTVKKETLFESYPEIIEIVSLQGLHSGANYISGDFSLSAEGFLYKNGKRQYSLKPFTISGNILDIFSNVEAIADDFQFNMSSVGAASLLVNALSISG